VGARPTVAVAATATVRTEIKIELSEAGNRLEEEAHGRIVKTHFNSEAVKNQPYNSWTDSLHSSRINRANANWDHFAPAFFRISATSGCLFHVAKRTGVPPSFFFALRSAPFSISSFTVSTCPNHAA
jgi:hypothetical protein